MKSYLFVPGDRAERFDKALATGAHAVIIDLEDAVAPEAKVSARAAIGQWLHPDKPIYLRCNAYGTPWFDGDLDLLSHPGVRGLVLPKAQEPDLLIQLAKSLRPDQRLLPIVESVFGWDRARELASAPAVDRLIFGSVDFASDAGMGSDGEELNAVRTHLVLVSRLAGVRSPVDGVTLAFADDQALASDVARARRMGMGAKLCIHPKQVAGVNQGFAPSASELEWAQRVLQSVEQHGLGAIAVDGKLVDRHVWLLAQSLVAEAHASGHAAVTP
jgi:citrate lyase subunit beta/citryl-CoA lyase